MDPINNIGSVIYTKTNTGITAVWVFAKNGKTTHGTGVGIRSTQPQKQNGFEGTYEIIYTTSEGVKYPPLKLIISQERAYYKLVWQANGKDNFAGIGLENNNKLSAGWFDVVETPSS